MSDEEKKGIWRTVRGRRVFIEEGQSLSEAMLKSGKFKETQNKDLDYDESPYYRDLTRQIFELGLKEEELDKNEPERRKLDKAPEGWTQKEWSEMSKTEREAMLNLFDRLNEGKDEHDLWMEQKIELDKERARVFDLMKEVQREAFERSGGNTFANKLPNKAELKEYEGFKLDTREYHQDYFENPEYARSKGYKEVYIAEMSPDEYMERCAREIFSEVPSVMERHIPHREDIQRYADMMGEGIKFDMPYLDVKNRAQEGRHRALAAKERGIRKIPVLYLK